MALQIEKMTFIYDSAIEPLFTGVSCHFPPGWSGIVGPNGSGKSTLLKLAAGILEQQDGSITRPDTVLYCAQRTDTCPPLLPEMLQSADGTALKLKGQLGLDDEWPDRWDTLSHGERKRAQLGVALWQNPDALAIDEPTNHIDSCARKMIIAALRAYNGIGLLVSHDRGLLDGLCSQCLFVDPPAVITRSGNYTDARQQADKDMAAAARQRDLADKEVKRLEKEVKQRRQKAQRSDKQRSKRGISRKDNDARAKKDLARLSGKDASAGKQLNQLKNRAEQARDKLEGIYVKKTYETGIWLEGSCSRKDILFRIPAGSLPLNENRRLEYPELTMGPADRIALTGPNGSGKSTLIRHLVNELHLPPEHVIYLPQEIALSETRTIMEQVKLLPHDKLGHAMTVVSCLGSRPQRLLDSTEPSPGEIRKILLAEGISRQPHLIIMDEPTNHLDLPSIESLENALQGCPCGLLLISHDQVFLDNLANVSWRIGVDDCGNGMVKTKLC